MRRRKRRARRGKARKPTLYAGAAFAPVRDGLEARTGDGDGDCWRHAYFQRTTPTTMLIDEVEALWAPIAERDDWSLFEAKLADVAALNAALGAWAFIEAVAASA